MTGKHLTSVAIPDELSKLAKEHGIKYSVALREGIKLLAGKRGDIVDSRNKITELERVNKQQERAIGGMQAHILLLAERIDDLVGEEEKKE